MRRGAYAPREETRWGLQPLDMKRGSDLEDMNVNTYLLFGKLEVMVLPFSQPEDGEWTLFGNSLFS